MNFTQQIEDNNRYFIHMSDASSSIIILPFWIFIQGQVNSIIELNYTMSMVLNIET
jgi:hypothetical protein